MIFVIGMSTEPFKTRTATTWMDEELGVIRVVYDRGALCTLADAKENVEVQLLASGGKSVPVLCDISKSKGVDQEARAYFAQIKRFRALALLTATPVANIVGNMYLAIHGKSTAPTKLFSSETEAIAWLKGFID